MEKGRAVMEKGRAVMQRSADVANEAITTAITGAEARDRPAGPVVAISSEPDAAYLGAARGRAHGGLPPCTAARLDPSEPFSDLYAKKP